MSGEEWCSCRGLSKSYGKLEVFKHGDLVIRSRELVGLVGENGSGKSTFLKCLLGFAKPSAGHISLSASFGYCPQDDLLNGKYTVAEHFELVEAIYRRKGTVDRAYVQDIINRLGLARFTGVQIGELSSGTYQKVKLATAILHRPRLILLDEPYDGFDRHTYEIFWEFVGELRCNGSGILVVSHFFYDFDRFDRIYELGEGRLVQVQ